MSDLSSLAKVWRHAEQIVVLTGAGLSTASGIPDFRSPGGRWSNYQPVTIQEFMQSQRSREEYWRYKGETWQLISEAPPNAAHVALTDLAKMGRVDLLVTQNVDGLHERSGFPNERLINIHGTDSQVECMSCHQRAPRSESQKRGKRERRFPLVVVEELGNPPRFHLGKVSSLKIYSALFKRPTIVIFFLR